MIQFAFDHPLLAYLAAGIICAAVFTESQRWLLPLRIPAAEIDKLAGDLMANFGLQAADIAALEQDRALHNSDPFEQGKWRRVEREIVNKHSNGTPYRRAKGPPVCDWKEAPGERCAERMRSAAASPEGALRGVFFEDQARFLKRQLSLPVSMISQ